MSLRRLCFVVTLATVALFTAIRSANLQFDDFAIGEANFGPRDPAFEAKVLPSSLQAVQTKNTKNLAAGKLLVASRGLADPHFAETVVLLVRYDDDGVVGLILNRRTHVPISQVLKDFATAKGRSDTAYLGGPVEMPDVFALLKSPAKVDGAEHVFDSVYLISAKPAFEQTMSAKPGPDVFHVYLGYAGWNKDQLRIEVELGAWFVFPGDTSTVFNSDPDSLWPQMIRKTELEMAENRRWIEIAPARVLGPIPAFPGRHAR